jgi:hypothetical protein
MERPGSNPQALAHSLGRQRSGAGKNKKETAQRIRRRACAGEGKGEAQAGRECHGCSVRCQGYSIFSAGGQAVKKSRL